MGKSEHKSKKELSDVYVSSRVNISEDQAVKELTEAEFAMKHILDEKDNDEHLQSAKNIVKDLNAGYSSAIKHEKAKIDFLLKKIEEARAIKSIT